MFFKTMKMRTQLFLMIAILAVSSLIYQLVNYLTLQDIKIEGSYYKKIMKVQDLINDMAPPSAYILEPYLLAFQEFFEKDEEQLQQLIKKSQYVQKQYNETKLKWAHSLPEGQIRDLFLNQSDNYAQAFFTIWQNDYLSALRAGDKDKAYAILMGPLANEYRLHREHIDKIIPLIEEDYNQLERIGQALYEQSLWISWLSWLFILLLSGIFAYLIAKSLTTRLKGIAQGLELVSQQIHATSNQQTQSTAQQSSAVNQTTVTMDELNASFQQTQTIAQESSQFAKQAAQVSENGTTQLKQVMARLSKQRDNVSQILDHILRLSQLTRQIHNIASLTSNLTNQTNILALNAAVQAAHVKQYGEGFSVIAGEIRKLGDESKKFLSHIDTLSENIQQATDSTIKIVEEGNTTIQDVIQLAQSTSSSFDSIISITNNSVEGAEQTSLNVAQQGIAVHEILEAMEELSRISQQTLQGMQQIHEELAKLNGLTQNLKNII